MTGISIGANVPNAKKSPWPRYGLTENPFPPSGVPTDVDYDAHQPDEVRAISTWLTKSVEESTTQWSPLAISGSIGVGKTHVLRKMERACAAFRDAENLGPRLMLSSQTLVGSGMKTLLLSNLLLDALNQPLPSGSVATNAAEMPILAAAIEQMVSEKTFAILGKLPASSPILKPLTRIAASRNSAQTAILVQLLGAWLARRNLTRGQLDLLGLGNKLEGEGQAVRAFAHVCLFARLAMGFRVWFLFIDQMEDLWRRDVTTSLRRTRFLTDLRTLIDESLEGCPVAVTLAWNTEVLVGASRVEEDIERRLQHDYLAMFSRIQNVIHISTLPEAHLLPFAKAYVDYAHARHMAERGARGNEGQDGKFWRAIERERQGILARVADYGRRQNGALVARAWLDALREWADEFVTAPTER
jgi:hypothetical protein